MGMLTEIFNQYVEMRRAGLDKKEVLGTLRAYIDTLPKPDKDQLAHNLRAWEAGDAHMPLSAPEPASPQKPSVIQPLGKKQSSGVIRSLSGSPKAPEDDPATWIACAVCGKKNRKNDVFCYSCGNLLEPKRGEHDTRHFTDAIDTSVTPDYFGPDSVLILEIRDANQFYEIRPQKSEQEIIIGRSSSTSAMVPDIDLAEFKAADLGVSRLHLAIKYEPDDNVIRAFDLGSANSSYINGQKLHPKEQRVLRHDDELRVGRLVIRVSFRHPGEEVP